MFRPMLPVLFAAASLACAGATQHAALPMQPLQPRAGERVVVDHATLIFDSSGSISENRDFPGEKALFESFVAGMPAGGYDASSVAFGGYERQTHALSAFDRDALIRSAQEIRYLSEGTPLDAVFHEVRASLAGKGDRAAVVVFSDGVPTDPVGRPLATDVVLDAARGLAEGYRGQVCFHTVQVGSDPHGEAFLRELAGLTSCGTTRRAAETMEVAAVGGFEREVFLGVAAAAPVARRAPAPGDADGDGVTDDRDACPNTPAAAKADDRGCWSIPWLEFATNSAEIRPDGRERLVSEVMPVLEGNPGLRIRVDGHTDARGSAEYNQDLSERRAKSVQDFLMSRGVVDARVESKGWGEAKPIAPNDNAANLQRNRRTELTVLN